MRLMHLYHFERFRDDRNVNVLRHKEHKLDLWNLRSSGRFDRYQNDQSWDVFGEARYVISFIAERYRYARFVGVWEVLSKKKRKKDGRFLYKTREIPGFDDLAGRLVVRWGEGTRSWAQWLHSQGNKEIVELYPPNYVMDFPGFYNVTLSYDELETMVNNPDSNREWQRMLSSVAGVYVILDQRSGKQYVGSAYGSGGIWARWQSYVKSPSGGNALLKKLLQASPGRYKHFQYSILRILEPNATKEEVIQQETLTKRKLGSRAFGLNSN
jgi:hypothetical protein